MLVQSPLKAHIAASAGGAYRGNSLASFPDSEIELIHRYNAPPDPMQQERRKARPRSLARSDAVSSWSTQDDPLRSLAKEWRLQAAALLQTGARATAPQT